MTQKKMRPLYLAIIIFILLLPIVVLMFKTAPYWEDPDILQFEKTATSSPTYDNYLKLAVAYINKNQPEKSLGPLEKAKSLKPDSAVVYNNLGVAYIQLKRIDEGIAACRKAIEIDPSFQLAKNNLNWGLSEKEKLKKK